MSYTGLIFNANLNADKIFIDYSNLPDTIQHKFFITILNQSISTLYFKITSFISNWTLTSPTDGKLGAISSGATSVFTITITRSKPTEETIDTGYLRVEAYTDSNYINLVGYADLNVTIYIEDLENWTDVTIYDFNDGTPQGWSLSSGLSVTNEKSVEVGGYSIKTSTVNSTTATFYIVRNIALPNRNKVRINFYKSLTAWATLQSATMSLRGLSVKVNDVKIFDIPFDIILVSLPANSSTSIGWYKFCADLSAYKGQTVALKIEWTIISVYAYGNTVSYLDRIVIAGKD
jgi:hypothetical protein